MRNEGHDCLNCLDLNFWGLLANDHILIFFFKREHKLIEIT